MILIAVIKRNKKCLYTLLELFGEYSIKLNAKTKIKLHFPLHFNKIIKLITSETWGFLQPSQMLVTRNTK